MKKIIFLHNGICFVQKRVKLWGKTKVDSKKIVSFASQIFEFFTNPKHF